MRDRSRRLQRRSDLVGPSGRGCERASATATIGLDAALSGNRHAFRGETAMSNIMQAAVVETLEKPHVLQEVPRASSRCDMSNITLLTRDGARFEFPCAASDYILDAAAAANLYLPAICHEGTCGACHAHVSQG